MKKILIFKKSKSQKIKKSNLETFLKKYCKNSYFLKVCSFENLFFNFCEKEISLYVEDLNILKFDLVFFRTWNGFQPIATAIANVLEKKNIKFIDKAVILPKHGNKITQMTILKLAGMEIPKTIFISKNIVLKKINFIIKKIGFPLILKAPNGSKGKNNFLIKNEKQLIEIINEIKFDPIIQEFIPNDFRFLVLGNSVPVAIKRIRQNKKIHQNNASMGAKEVFLDPHKVNQKLIKMSIKAAKLFQRQVAGIDIIVSKKTKKPYILEVNPGPGFTYEDYSPEVKELNKYLTKLISL